MATATTNEELQLLNSREASQCLGVSERTLWEHTQPRGPIPAVRIGTCVRYSLEALKALAAQQEGGAA